MNKDMWSHATTWKSGENALNNVTKLRVTRFGALVLIVFLDFQKTYEVTPNDVNILWNFNFFEFIHHRVEKLFFIPTLLCTLLFYQKSIMHLRIGKRKLYRWFYLWKQECNDKKWLKRVGGTFGSRVFLI